MAIICDRARTVYFPVPKAACTSLKALFWEINHGRAWPRKLSWSARVRRKLGLSIFGETLQTEVGYRTEIFNPGIVIPPDYERIAVVRDPLARLHSAWSNKVNRKMFDRHHEVEKLGSLGLSSSPTFAEFVEHFNEYRSQSIPVARHTGGFTQYLGDDLDWFTHVFPIERLQDLEAYLQERTKYDVRIPIRNKGRPDVRAKSLNTGHRDMLAVILADDYRLLANFYSLDEAIGKFVG